MRWFVYEDGLKIWLDGNLIGTIDPKQFPYLIEQIAQHMRYSNEQPQPEIKTQTS